jgi:hypothetical protein
MSHNAGVTMFQVIVNWLANCFRSEFDMVFQTKSPKGIIAVGIFLSFAAMMASLAGTALVWRDTILDRVWAINAPAYARLAPFGKTVGIPFLLLGATLAVAGASWFKRRRWGWRLVIAIIATEVLGNIVNAFMGDVVRGGVGFVIAGGLPVYLLRPEENRRTYQKATQNQ